MDELKIELKDGYSVLKKIYYRDGNGSILTWKGTKAIVYFTLIFTLLSVTFYVVALRNPQTNWIVLAVLCSIITCYVAIFLVIRGRKYFIWKNSVEQYLNGIRKYESQWLTATSHTLELSNPDETTIEKWDDIKLVSIYKDYILLRGGITGSYMFPEKSMTTDEFSALKDFVKKIMNEDSGKVLQVHAE